MAKLAQRVLMAGLAALAGIGLGLTPAAAEPAIWVVKDKQSTIYLFGTFHALPTEGSWETPKIAKALSDSQELWLELVDDDVKTILPLVSHYGHDPAHPLSSLISTGDLARLDQAAKEAGLPGEAGLEAIRPWLAALTLTAVPFKAAGFSPDDGADHVLRRQAESQGKMLHAFETAEQQIRIFADLPATDQLALLQSTLDDIGDGPAKIEEMAQAWRDGDVSATEKLFAEFQKPQYQALYKALIVDRNRNWAEQLAQRLKTGPGAIFVAVGAGHLAGPDSLIVDLAKRGIKAERE
jgi:uncharacterized protein YbaP (TraB family)